LMYYTGFDPYSGKKVYVAKLPEDKQRQKDFFFRNKKKRVPYKVSPMKGGKNVL